MVTRHHGVRLGCVLLALSLAACGTEAPAPRTKVQAGPTAPAPVSSPPAAAVPDPPNAAPAPKAAAVPPRLAGKVIVVDPGHNGGSAAHPEVIDKLVDAYTMMKPCNTTGTETDDGYPEHAFTFDVAVRVRALLVAAGATVVLTRPDDKGIGPCITERAAIGNRSKAAAVLSIHGDAAAADQYGFHVMEPVRIPGAPNAKIVDVSHRYALVMRDHLRAVEPPATYAGHDGISEHSDMAGLNLSLVPVVMVECGNMRNAADARKMRDAAYRQKLAAALVAGVAAFVTTG
jgi:N-acetylmuramoyl-L-alanine amidase